METSAGRRDEAGEYEPESRFHGWFADEQTWREMPCEKPSAPSQVFVGHWTDERIGKREFVAPVSDRHYTVSILLGLAVVDCYKNGRLRGKGTGGIGGLQLTAPGELVVCGFRGSNESLHIFLPCEFVESEYSAPTSHDGPLRFDDPGFRVDPIIGPLACALVKTGNREGAASKTGPREKLIYEILRHVLSRYTRDVRRDGGIRGLSASRLRRVVDYIDANLAEPITLQDIALQAGLSRMHFAAQFRLATGRTPHAFLRERRVERAKALLLLDRSIVEVALAVGFQGQSHFTNVFHEISGETPRRWRARERTMG